MKVKAGTPVKFTLREFRELTCCDCGLVHLMVVEKVVKKVVYIKFYRDDHATARIRKSRKKK